MDKMGKLCVFFVVALITNEAVGMTFRHKRQSDDEGDNSLDDRYGGWDRPRRPWRQQQNQWQQPNQGGQQQWQQPNQGGQQQWQQLNQGGQQQWQQPNQGGQQQWPDQGGDQQWPLPNQSGQQQQPNGSGSTTQTPTVENCIRSCPTTPEYNPVCGTNGVTYNNPGRLTCAQQCGVNVNVVRSSPCPTTTTAAPS